MTLEPVANYGCHIGENPLWHASEKKLYWLDISAGTIFRYEPSSGTHEVFYRGDVTSGFTFQQDGSLLLFGVKGAVHHLHHGKITTLIDQLPGEEHNRFNDVVVEPSGRVLCGTMPCGAGSSSGSLYRLELDGAITKLREGIHLSNGMGFSPDLKTFYHVDSMARTVSQYDYDPVTGDLTQPRLFTRLSEASGLPDGLTVDAEGYIWLANWDGWQLQRYDPAGNLERQIRFPVKKVSSLTFGGEDYSDIYITTAGGDRPLENGELAGALFHFRAGIKGKPEFLSKIQIPGF